MALWFHDGIYEPLRSDNEARSADLAEAMLSPVLPASLVAAVRSMIFDTRHREPPSSPDGAVVVDGDLSILGAPSLRLLPGSDSPQLRLVPAFLYRRRRRKVSEGFRELDPPPDRLQDLGSG